MCAGRRFAEQDMYVLLCTILRKFKLTYAVGETMDAVYHTLLFPDRPLRIKFQSRQWMFFFVLSILWSLVKCNFQIFFWINFGYTLKKLWLHNYVHTCLLLLSKWTSFKFVKCERIFERKSLRNSSNENNWVRSKRLKHLLLLSL